MPEPKPLAKTLALTDPKTVAVALSDGGKLESVEDDGTRLVFHLVNLPADWGLRLASGEITVSGRDVIARMESVLSLIAERQRRTRR